MHLAPMRRRPWRPSPAAFLYSPLIALLLAGGCAIPEPGPSPMVCPSSPGGCADEDAPWYRQDVTAMIPPPPVDPMPPPEPAADEATDRAEATDVDPWADPYRPEPMAETVVSRAARPEETTETADTPSSEAVAPAQATPGGVTAAGGRQQSGKADTRDTDTAAATVVRLPSDRLFELAGATLQPTGRRALDALADQLHGTDYTHIRVIGHTDRSGKAETNLKLSSQRARAVRDHLATRGIPSELLVHEGRGSRDAVVDPTRCGRKKDERMRCLGPDRRIDIVISRRLAP